MAFNLQDVATQTNIGQNLFGPSWTLTQDIRRSEIYRQDAKKDAIVRDVVMKGLPVITEAQLRKNHELKPISMVVKEKIGKNEVQDKQEDPKADSTVKFGPENKGKAV